MRQQCRKLKSSNGRHGGSWVEPLPISEIEINIVGRYVKGTSPFDITVTSGRLRWHRNQSHTCAPCVHSAKFMLTQKQKYKTNRKKFYICADGPHTHKPLSGQKARSLAVDSAPHPFIWYLVRWHSSTVVALEVGRLQGALLWPGCCAVFCVVVSCCRSREHFPALQPQAPSLAVLHFWPLF